MEGRAHEKLVQIAPEQLPNRDVRIEEEFIAQNQALLTFCGSNLYFACEEVHGVLDADVLESLEALIAKYQTSLVYEPSFQNLIAAGVYRNFEKRADEFRVRLNDSGGNAEAVMDQYMFRLLVFLQRLAMVNNNGRARGRFFIQFLSGLTRSMSKPEVMAEGQ